MALISPGCAASVWAFPRGAAIGCVTGLLITRLKLAPFIVTLGMLGVMRGGANLLSNGQEVSEIPSQFVDGGAYNRVRVASEPGCDLPGLCRNLRRRPRQDALRTSHLLHRQQSRGRAPRRRQRRPPSRVHLHHLRILCGRIGTHDPRPFRHRAEQRRTGQRNRFYRRSRDRQAPVCSGASARYSAPSSASA